MRFRFLEARQEAKGAAAREKAREFFKGFLAKEPGGEERLFYWGELKGLLTHENRLRARDYFFRLNYGSEEGDLSFAATVHWEKFRGLLKNAGKPLSDSIFVHELVEMRELEKAGFDLHPRLLGTALSKHLDGIFDSNMWAHAKAVFAESLFLSFHAREQKIPLSVGTALVWNPSHRIKQKQFEARLLEDNGLKATFVEGESAAAQAFFRKILKSEGHMLVDGELYG